MKTKDNYPLDMPYKIVSVDRSRSSVAQIVYDYGEQRYFEGLATGVIYATISFIFLVCVKELSK